MQKGTLTKICADIFTTPDDAVFLEEMAARFPKVGEGFARFAAMAPETRPAAARASLRALPRTGWLRIGIPAQNVESVYTHIKNSVKLASLLGDAANVTRLMKMMAVHDLGEAVHGDFTPYDKITAEEKRRLEKLSLRLILQGAPNGREKLALWQEFEDNRTPTARLANDIDRIDLALQARAYMLSFPALKNKLQDFVDYAEARIKTPVGQAFLRTITPHNAPTRILRP